MRWSVLLSIVAVTSAVSTTSDSKAAASPTASLLPAEPIETVIEDSYCFEPKAVKGNHVCLTWKEFECVKQMGRFANMTSNPGMNASTYETVPDFEYSI